MFPSNAKLLIVDDMKTMRKLLMKHLRDLGFTDFAEAEDGDKALEMIQAAVKAGEPFACVISDWNMPKMKGIDLLKKVRADAKTGGLPFLMVTAEVEASSIQEAKAAKASGFLSKPFKAEELKQQLSAAFSTHGKKAA